MTKIGFLILFVLTMVFGLIFIEIGGMPGRDARKRGHPHAEAIGLLGWLGLPLGVFGWLVAMIWARVKIEPLEVVPVAVPVEVGDDTQTTE
jgi:hypothetical protein